MDQGLPYHSYSIEKVFRNFESTRHGLDKEQAARRLHQIGKNRLKEKQEKSLFRIFIDQINNPVIYLLTAAATVSFLFQDIPEAIAIIVVIIFNGIIGFWMEYQARTSMASLKKLDRLTARVVRNGEDSEINSENLVPGDIIILEAGNLVPADGRLIECANFSTDESPLTGESLPMEKDSAPVKEQTPLADRNNMVYKGTSVTNGNAEVLITATGMHTEIGKISRLVDEAGEEKVPLNEKLAGLSRTLIWVTVGLAALFFLAGWLSGKEMLYQLLQTAIAWTVAAIPEGLPIVASIALARGMLRLARHNVIIKKLSAVETLGETTIIFTDKTGTLTENKLSVASLSFPGREWLAETDIIDDLRSGEEEELENFRHFIKIAVLCNNAEIENDSTKGDPLEIALLRFAGKMNPRKTQHLQEWQKIKEDPFNSESKRMITAHKDRNRIYVAMKGATSAVLRDCTSILSKGQVNPMDEKERQTWLEKDTRFSEKGFRVLSFAYYEQKKVNHNHDEPLAEVDFIYAGMVGFMDPSRKDIPPAMEDCHHAGIRVIMVTGDHPGTALNIARAVHLLEPGARENAKEMVTKGDKLQPGETGPDDITSYSIFARVNPAQKLDIVRHFKDKGDITAMTGDGINDTPAMKTADIGIAMGKRGSQAAQEVADIILKDDSFPSIVRTIKQGRIIFENIRKFIIYQLSYHIAEILIIAAVSFSVYNLPLLPLQLLFLNLLSDVFPALALGIGKGNENVMNRNPKDPEEAVLKKQNWISIAVYGLTIAAFAIATYFVSYSVFNHTREMSNSITFFTLALTQLLHVFDMKEADEPLFLNQVTRNKYIWYALLFCLSALVAAYYVPLLHEALSFENLGVENWLQVGITSVSTLLFIQILKKVFHL